MMGSPDNTMEAQRECETRFSWMMKTFPWLWLFSVESKPIFPNWNKQTERKINMIIHGASRGDIYSTIWLYLFNVKTLSNCRNLSESALTRKNYTNNNAERRRSRLALNFWSIVCWTVVFQLYDFIPLLFFLWQNASPNSSVLSRPAKLLKKRAAFFQIIN